MTIRSDRSLLKNVKQTLNNVEVFKFEFYNVDTLDRFFFSKHNTPFIRQVGYFWDYGRK